MTPDPITPADQHARFLRGLALLGEKKAAAVYLDCSERQVHYLVTGERAITPRWMERLARALIAHADLCREFERQISPAFASNLTAAQIHTAARKKVKHG